MVAAVDSRVVVTSATGTVIFEVGTGTAIVTSGTTEISAMDRPHSGEILIEIGAAAIVILMPEIRGLGSVVVARVLRRLFLVTSAMRESLQAAILIWSACDGTPEIVYIHHLRFQMAHLR